MVQKAYHSGGFEVAVKGDVFVETGGALVFVIGAGTLFCGAGCALCGGGGGGAAGGGCGAGVGAGIGGRAAVSVRIVPVVSSATGLPN